MNNIIEKVWKQQGLTPIEFLPGNTFTAEAGAHTFIISGVDQSGAEVALSGSPSASFIRADGTTVAISSGATLTNGKVHVTLSEECYGVTGRFALTVFLTSNGQKVAIYACVGNVARSNTSAVSPGVTADVVDLVNQINTATASIPASYTALLAAIAEDYTDTSTYKKGDFRWHSGTLYRAKQDIETAESWTAGHWEQVVLSNSLNDDITSLKSAIDILGYQKKEFKLTAGEQHTSTKDICYIDIKEGQIFTIVLATYPAGAVTRLNVYAYYEDRTSEQLISKVNLSVDSTFTATKDIRGIGCFLADTYVVADCTLSVQVIINGAGYVVYAVNNLTENVPEIETELKSYEFSGQSDSVNSWVSKTTKAVTANGDGTFTIGTNDYGTIVFKKLHVLPGNYKLYGVAGNGYSYLSSGENYSTAFVSNNTDSEIVVTIEQEQDCYLGFRNGSKPSESYVITPYLVPDRIVGINNNIRDIVLKNSKSITTTVLGADLPSNASAVFGLPNEYITVLKNAIDTWMGEYAGDAQKVPFIVHTDQHGLLDAGYKGLFDLISYLVNWNETSVIFNLGDTVTNNYVGTSGMQNPLLRCSELEDALMCLSNVPKDKQVNLWGNHDSWYTGDIDTPVTGTLPDMKYLNPYFLATGLRTIRQGDNTNLQIVYDDRYRIKYLCVADWDYADRGSTSQYAYTLFWISPDHWRWLISEMSKNDGYSLVLVSHVPLLMGSDLAYDPITGASRTKSTPEMIVTERSVFNAVWAARKAKTSGTITVKDEVINFDFTGCTDDCLCALAGHTHYDGVDYVEGANGLLQISFDRLSNHTIHFGLIDKRNNKVIVWKVSNDDSTPLVQNWEASFDYQAN